MKPALLVVLFVVGVSALPIIVPINPNSLPGSSLGSTLISSEKVKNLLKGTPWLNNEADVDRYQKKLAKLKGKWASKVQAGAATKKIFKTLIWPFKKDKEFGDILKIEDSVDSEMQPLLFGDILFTEEQLDHLLANEGRQKRQASTVWKAWTSGAVNYYFDPNAGYSAAQKAIIRSGFQYWSDNTCVTFTETQTPPNKIKVTNTLGSGCFATIGMQSNGQQMSLPSNCITTGTAAHEMAHAMGVFHHQSRHDRDNYIEVHPENIKPDQDSQAQYNELTTSDSNNHNTLYDYGSVMHYGDDFFTNGNGPTMVAADPLHQKTMGSREGPTFQDITLVNQHYNCLGNCPSLSCQNNGYPNPANCDQCICPGGFAGTLCDERPAGTNAGCTGDTLTATDTWQMASGSLNKPFQQGVNKDYCYWWITAPEGSTIDIQLAEMTRYASCGMTGMEVKAGNMTLTGYKICPPGTGSVSLTNIPTITSKTNQVVIRLYNQWGDFNFKLQYALTGSGPPPPPPPPCNNQYSNCNELASYCTTDPDISTSCPVTCGTCPTGK